jgi:hypothetical protein
MQMILQCQRLRPIPRSKSELPLALPNPAGIKSIHCGMCSDEHYLSPPKAFQRRAGQLPEQLRRQEERRVASNSERSRTSFVDAG